MTEQDGSVAADPNASPYDMPPLAHLFKFRDVPAPGTKEESWRRAELVHAHLYFAKPSELNDPFDSQPYFKNTATPVDLLLHSAANKWRLQGKRGKQRRKLIKAVGKRRRDPEFWAKMWRGSLDRYGFYCLTEVNDHPLMWGHYSRGHRGYCLEYSIPDALWTENLLPVRTTYSNERQFLSTAALLQAGRRRMAPADFARSVQHKDSAWQYEMERRMMRLPAAGGSGIVHAPPSVITGVILGACLSIEDERRLHGWVDERGAPTQVRRARLRPTSYGIDIIEGHWR